MEFVSGGDLSKLMDSNSLFLGNETVKIFIAEMVLAFYYLHSKQIYHRDIKPENILITKEVGNFYNYLGSF